MSAAVLACAAPDGIGARLWVSEEDGAPDMSTFREGGVAKESEAIAWLVKQIAGMVSRGARCLVVEDSMSRPSDPALTNTGFPVAFLGDSVFAWCDLPPAPGHALPGKVIRAGGGYPTNAFVVSTPASVLGLGDRREVPATFPEAVGASVEAVVVSVHDAESYLIWEREQGRDAASRR